MNALRDCTTSLAPCTLFVCGTPLRTRSEGAAIVVSRVFHIFRSVAVLGLLSGSG